MKLRLIGQLIDESKPVILWTSDPLEMPGLMSENACSLRNTWMLRHMMVILVEYTTVFPNIFLSIEIGEFRTPMTTEKKKALAELIRVLQSPLQNLFLAVITK